MNKNAIKLPRKNILDFFNKIKMSKYNTNGLFYRKKKLTQA